MKKRDDRSLRELLRRHDPAAGTTGLDPTERARIRQALVEATRVARDRPGLRWPLVAGALAAALFAVGLGVAMYLRTARSGDSAGPGSGTVPATVRQVQIVTPGGTRVVWILNSDFKL